WVLSVVVASRLPFFSISVRLSTHPVQVGSGKKAGGDAALVAPPDEGRSDSLWPSRGCLSRSVRAPWRMGWRWVGPSSRGGLRPGAARLAAPPPAAATPKRLFPHRGGGGEVLRSRSLLHRAYYLAFGPRRRERIGTIHERS